LLVDAMHPQIAPGPFDRKGPEIAGALKTVLFRAWLWGGRIRTCATCRRRQRAGW